MEWIRDISTTIFFPLILGICLVLAAIICANYGKRKGYSFWGCLLESVFGTIPGIIFVVLLPNISRAEEQQAASFRYRDKEIETLKAELETCKRRISQMEDILESQRLNETAEN